MSNNQPLDPSLGNQLSIVRAQGHVCWEAWLAVASACRRQILATLVNSLFNPTDLYLHIEFCAIGLGAWGEYVYDVYSRRICYCAAGCFYRDSMGK